MTTSLENLTPEQLENMSRGKALLDSLLNDPETRKATMRLIKKKNPNMPLPEIDTEDAAAAILENERKEREKLEAKVRESEARESVRAKREEAVEKGWVGREEIPALEKFMTDNEIPSYEKAASLFKQAKRAEAAHVAERKSGDNTLSMPDNKELYKNPTLWARQQASAAVDEIVAGRRA